MTEVWLVSEFCNRGPLLTAVERGAFLTQPSSQFGQPNLISVLQVGGQGAEGWGRGARRRIPLALGPSGGGGEVGGEAGAGM